MTAGRTLVGVLGAVVTGTAGIAAQATATVDLGVSRVHYDRFLPSAAVALTPTITLERPGGSVRARATYLLFESGNRSIQGGVQGSVFRALTGGWRLELLGSAAGSRYADFASFWHALCGARVFRPVGRATIWADLIGGAASHGEPPRPFGAASAGIWTSSAGLEIAVSASHTRIGDTVYTDLRAEGVRRLPSGVAVEGNIGTRVWSRGGGHGVYGEGSAAIPLAGSLTLVLAGGRYPTDPARGSISGRYGSVALRFMARPRTRPAARRATGRASRSGSASHASPLDETGARLAVRAGASGAVRLRVHAARTSSVEVAGDFTDWSPVPLSRTGPGLWEITLVIPAGVHRINVRLDRGSWLVPLGTTPAADDFGTETGLFVVR